MIEEITPTLQPGNDSTKILAQRSAWEKGEFGDLTPILQSASTPKQAADLVISEQYYRWKHGDHRRIEKYVEDYPSLRSDSRSLMEMLRAEIVLRREYREEPNPIEYETFFPELSGELHHLLDSQRSENLEATLGVAEADIWKPRGKTLASDAPQITGYELLEELGRGGMGVVFRAKQLLADREVALKIIRPDSLALLDPAAREGVIRRFGAEARAAAKLNNDHIVTVYDIGECRGFHFYTMKLVEGPSLSNLLREKPLDDQSAARYCMEASLGVHAAHELGILHRDLKPSNVMLDRVTGRALVADFGLAKIASEGREQLTHSGDVVGTPAYMPPEQATDSSTVTAQSDVYSLGATLYHAITGRPPFQAASLGEILRQIADDEPIPPRRMNPRINRDLETICLKAMQKAPAQRYATAKDFADDLRRFIEGRPILARPVSRPEAIWRWCKRNPQLAGAIGTATSLALLAIISIVVGYIQTSIAFNQTTIALGNSKRRLEKSLSLVDELFTKVSEDDLLNEPGMQVVRKQLLARAKSHYEELLSDSTDLPIAKEELAAAHYRFGRISSEMGEAATAKRELTLAEKEQRRLLKDSPDSDKRQLALAETLMEAAKIKQMDEKYQELVGIYRESLALRNQVVEKNPKNLDYQRIAANARMNLGFSLKGIGELPNAQREFEAAQAARESILKQDTEQQKTRRDYAKGAFNLGSLFKDLALEKKQPGLEMKAIEQFQIAAKTFETLTKAQPRILDHRLNYTKSLRALASVKKDAEEEYNQAKSVIERLVEDNPEVVDYRVEAGQLQLELGIFLEEKMRLEEAIAVFTKCEDTLNELSLRKANAAEFVATCLLHRGKSEAALNQNENAIASLKRSLEWWDVLLKQTADDPFLHESKEEVQKLLANLMPPTPQEPPASK